VQSTPGRGTTFTLLLPKRSRGNAKSKTQNANPEWTAPWRCLHFAFCILHY
jgi:hypothetical protein